MGVYRIINSNIKDIMDFILEDDELKLLLYHPSRDALDKMPNNISIKSLMENNLYPYANISEPEDNVKSFISIYMNNGKNAGVSNVYQRDLQIFVDILCHETIWTMNEGLIRPYLILDNLDINIPNIKTESIRGSLSYVDTIYIQYNKKFCGYRLIYSVTNPSKGCSN